MSGYDMYLGATERRGYYGRDLRGALLQLDLLAHGIGEPAIPADCQPALQRAVQDALNAVRAGAVLERETERDLRDARNTIAWLRHTLDQTRALLDAAQQRAQAAETAPQGDSAPGDTPLQALLAHAVGGGRVRLHPIIGGKHDGNLYEVTGFTSIGGHLEAVLAGLHNSVSIEALSIPARGLPDDGLGNAP